MDFQIQLNHQATKMCVCVKLNACESAASTCMEVHVFLAVFVTLSAVYTHICSHDSEIENRVFIFVFL